MTKFIDTLEDSKFLTILKELHEEFPGFRLVAKEESILMKVIFYGLFMFLWNKKFMENYTTVIIFWCYMPRRFIGTNRSARTLRHERIHLRDVYRWNILFVLSYIFVLPAGPGLRALWEFRGYRETMVAYFEDEGEIPDSLVEGIAKQFTSSNYLWMMPFKNYVMNKLRKMRTEILRDFVTLEIFSA